MTPVVLAAGVFLLTDSYLRRVVSGQRPFSVTIPLQTRYKDASADPVGRHKLPIAMSICPFGKFLSDAGP